MSSDSSDESSQDFIPSTIPKEINLPVHAYFVPRKKRTLIPANSKSFKEVRFKQLGWKKQVLNRNDLQYLEDMLKCGTFTRFDMMKALKKSYSTINRYITQFAVQGYIKKPFRRVRNRGSKLSVVQDYITQIISQQPTITQEQVRHRLKTDLNFIVSQSHLSRFMRVKKLFTVCTPDVKYPCVVKRRIC